MGRLKNFALVSVAVTVLAGCGTPAATKPSASPLARPSPSQAILAQIALSDSAIDVPESQPLLLFQAYGDGRLRGLSWDGAKSGLVTRSGSFGLQAQSPDGRYVLISGMLTDRGGHSVGPFPWQEKDMTATWSPDDTAMCKVPFLGGAGAPLRLEMAPVGQSPRLVARGFGTFHDQSAFPVLSCDPKADQAIVAEFSQGFQPSQGWVIRISSGAVIGTFTGGSTPIAATADGSLLLLANPGAGLTVVQSVNGTALATINGFEARGFSGDGSLLVGTDAQHRAVVLNWRTGRRLWSSSAALFGYIPEPNGPHLAVAIDGSDGSVGDAFLIGPSGALKRLPAGIAAGWKN